MRSITIMAAAALSLAVSQPAEAQDRASDFRWTGTLQQGRTVELRNVNGSITATPASGNEIEVVGVYSRRTDPEDIEIRVEETGQGVIICAIHHPEDFEGDGCEQRRNRRRHRHDDDHDYSPRVDFEARIPAGILLDAGTVNGDVDVRDLTADVNASSVNGDVYAETAGMVEASTVNGSIHATMGRADWNGEVEYSTVNGDIVLELPDGFGARIAGETVNGGLESDFPITIQGRWGPRRMNGVIGDGSRDLRLSTVNGSIRLLRNR